MGSGFNKRCKAWLVFTAVALFGVIAPGLSTPRRSLHRMRVPPGSDYRLWATPPPQASMSEPVSSPATPAFEVFVKPDLAVITTPGLPAGTVIRGKEITVSGVPITDPTVWTFIFSLWAYFLPLALIGAWMALAIWDIARRQNEMSNSSTVG